MFPLALEDTTMDWMLLASRWDPLNIFLLNLEMIMVFTQKES